jgi:hypothetical protein
MLLADILGFWGWFWILIFLVGIGQAVKATVDAAKTTVDAAKTIAKDERVQETFWTVVWKSLGGK